MFLGPGTQLTPAACLGSWCRQGPGEGGMGVSPLSLSTTRGEEKTGGEPVSVFVISPFFIDREEMLVQITTTFFFKPDFLWFILTLLMLKPNSLMVMSGKTINMQGRWGKLWDVWKFSPLETPPPGAPAVGQVSFEVYSFGSRLYLVFLSLFLSTELSF